MEKLICDNCNKKVRHLRVYRDELLCYICYQKSHKLILGGPLKFDEVLRRTGTFALGLTDSQDDFVESRILELGITKTAYIRELVITDMLNCEKNKK